MPTQSPNGITPVFVLGCLLIAMGYLYTGNQLPLPSLNQEVIAGLGWGTVSLAFYLQHTTSQKYRVGVNPALLALFAIPALSVIYSAVRYQHPYPFLVTLTVVSIVAAALVAAFGRTLAHSESGAKIRNAIYITLIAGGLLNAVIGIIQYLQIDAPLTLVSPLVVMGRSYGNIRQPNLYALLLATSFLLYLMKYLKYISINSKFNQIHLQAVFITLIYSVGLATSGSRSGVLFILTIFIFSLIIPSLKMIRPYTSLSLIFIISCWALMIFLDEKDVFPFYSTIRTLPGHPETADLSNSRFNLWENAIHSIAKDYGIGHGFYSVNKTLLNSDLASALTMASVSNIHNIFLQWALEHGIFTTSLWLISMIFWAHSIKDFYKDFEKSILFTAIMLAGLHSLLELPMWHINFLLPTAFFIGIISGNGKSINFKSFDFLKMKFVMTICIMMIATHTWFDAKKLTPIYQNENTSLVNRIEKAYRSVWFTHWIDQAVLGTIFVTPENAKMHIALSKKVENFFLSPQVLLMLSLAYYYEEDQERSLQLIRIVIKSEPEAIDSFQKRIPQHQTVIFQELIKSIK